MIWQALSRLADDWSRAVRAVGEGAGEAAALLVKLRADAVAVLDDAAEGLGLRGVVRSFFAAAAGLEQEDQAVVMRLPGRRMEEEFASAAVQRNADVEQADGVRTMPEAAGAVGSFHGFTVNFAAPPENQWQNALLALGALKVLSSTESLPGLAVALNGIAAYSNDVDGDASGVATPVMVGQVAVGVALQVHRKEQASFEAPGRAGTYASAAIAQARVNAFAEARLQGGGSHADGAEAWSPSRLADFDRAFGIGLHQSTPEQRLAFSDWESLSRRPAVQHKPADTKTSQLIEVAMNRYLGIEQIEDAEAVGHQGVASVGVTLQDRSLDDVAQSGAAAVSIALAAQSSAVTGLAGAAPASSTSETHIHGAITLVTQAMDGPAIARELAGMGRSQSLIQQGNSGIF